MTAGVVYLPQWRPEAGRPADGSTGTDAAVWPGWGGSRDPRGPAVGGTGRPGTSWPGPGPRRCSGTSFVSLGGGAQAADPAAGRHAVAPRLTARRADVAGTATQVGAGAGRRPLHRARRRWTGPCALLGRRVASTPGGRAVAGAARRGRRRLHPRPARGRAGRAGADPAAALQARDRAEGRGGASEARFRAVFADAVVGIGIADVDGNILEVNPALCDMLGYPSEEIRQPHVRRVPAPGRRPGGLGGLSRTWSRAGASPSGWRSGTSARTARRSGPS